MTAKLRGVGPAGSATIALTPDELSRCRGSSRIICPLCSEGFTWQRDIAKGERVSIAEGMGTTTHNGALVHIECAKLAERKANAIEA